MVNQGDAEFPSFDPSGRLGWLYIGNEPGRRLRLTGELPAQDVQKSSGCTGLGIEETLPVEVLGKERWAGARVHDSLFTHSLPRASVGSR